MKWQVKHTLCSYTCIMDPLELATTQTVDNQYNITDAV